MKSQAHISNGTNGKSSFWWMACTLVISMMTSPSVFASSQLNCDQVFAAKNLVELKDDGNKEEFVRMSFRDLYPSSDLNGARTVQSYERILNITLHLLSQYQQVLAELGIPSKILSPDRMMALSLLDQQKNLEEKYQKTKSPLVKANLDFIHRSIQDLMNDKMYIRNQFLTLKADADLTFYFPVLEVSTLGSSLPMIQSLKKYSIAGVPLRVMYSPLLLAEALFDRDTNRIYNSGDALIQSRTFMNEDFLHELIHAKLARDRSLGKEDFYSVVFKMVHGLENISGMSLMDPYVRNYLQQGFSLEELLTGKKTIAWQYSSDEKFQDSRNLSPLQRDRLKKFWLKTHLSMSQTAFELLKDLKSELKSKSELEVLAMTDLLSIEDLSSLENQRFHLFFESKLLGRMEVSVEISSQRIQKYLQNLPKGSKPHLNKLLQEYLKDVQSNIQHRHLAN